MKFTLESSATISVRAYGPGQITLAIPERASDAAERPNPPHSRLSALETVTTSLVLSPTQLRTDWPPQQWEEVAAHHFDSVLEMAPELVLFGTGAKLRFPSPALTRALLEQGIGVETMDTAAACRTFNILVAEGRHVVAALLMI